MKAMRALKPGVTSRSICLRRKLETILSAVILRQRLSLVVMATMAPRRVRKVSVDPRCTGMAIRGTEHPVPRMAT